jgi:hypothetical protein
MERRSDMTRPNRSDRAKPTARSIGANGARRGVGDQAREHEAVGSASDRCDCFDAGTSFAPVGLGARERMRPLVDGKRACGDEAPRFVLAALISPRPQRVAAMASASVALGQFWLSFRFKSRRNATEGRRLRLGSCHGGDSHALRRVGAFRFARRARVTAIACGRVVAEIFSDCSAALSPSSICGGQRAGFVALRPRGRMAAFC